MAQNFLLRPIPIVQVPAVRAASFLEHLEGSNCNPVMKFRGFGDRTLILLLRFALGYLSAFGCHTAPCHVSFLLRRRFAQRNMCGQWQRGCNLIEEVL